MSMLRQTAALLFSTSVTLLSTTAHSDTVINDDLIVTGIDGGACIGSDCVNNETFDFETLKLKTDDPLIFFFDTSNSASFPSNDWSIGVTDNASGGPANLVIRDVSAGVDVVVLQSNGGVALGAASTPEVNAISVGSTGNERRIMHVADGVDPTDAVNLSQMQNATSTIDSRIDAINTRIDDLLNRLDQL